MNHPPQWQEIAQLQYGILAFPVGGSRIPSGSSITKWNLLALVAVATGSAATWCGGQAWLNRWAGSGLKVPVSAWAEVELTAGEQLIYYESPVSVPTHNIHLTVRHPNGENLMTDPPIDDNNFEINGWHGRALFEANLIEAGRYTVHAFNANVASDDDVPADDRIVFAKRPNTKVEAIRVRRLIHLIGAVTTIGAGIILYLVHGLALHHRRTFEAINGPQRGPVIGD